MITIILLSHNNSHYLARALNYYKEVGFQGKIFIADSSCLKEQDRVREIVKKYQGDLFFPVIFEYENSVMFAEKVASVIEKVSTPYVLFAGVDDFFSLQSLREGVCFLNENPRYVFVMGYLYGYTYKPGSLDWYYWGDCDYPREFDQDDALERIDSYLKKYVATLYSLFRTSVLVSIFQQALAYANDEQVKFFENMVTMLALLFGKGHYLRAPFAWRELSGLSWGSQHYEKWLVDENFEKNKQSMELGIKKSFEKILQFDSEKSALKSKYIVQKFVEYNLSVISSQKKIGFKQSIKRYIPTIIWNQLKVLRCRRASIKRTQWSGELFLYDEKSRYYCEFELIKKLISNSKLYVYKSGLEDIKISQGYL